MKKQRRQSRYRREPVDASRASTVTGPACSHGCTAFASSPRAERGFGDNNRAPRVKPSGETYAQRHATHPGADTGRDPRPVVSRPGPEERDGFADVIQRTTAASRCPIICGSCSDVVNVYRMPKGDHTVIEMFERLEGSRSRRARWKRLESAHQCRSRTVTFCRLDRVRRGFRSVAPSAATLNTNRACAPRSAPRVSSRPRGRHPRWSRAMPLPGVEMPHRSARARC